MPRVSPIGDSDPAEFAVSSHQLLSVQDPGASIRVLIADDEERFAGRPYSVWRNDPELARILNDRLSSEKS
jgi:hypothetical protein